MSTSNTTLPQTHQVYISLAGCGKTTKLMELAEAAHTAGYRVLYLSFNKKIRAEVIKKSILPQGAINTFHSLAYNEIVGTDYLADLHNQYSEYELWMCFEGDEVNFKKGVKKFKSLSKKTMNSILSWWCEYSINSSHRNYDFIFVDELQDLNAQMVRMLRRLYAMNKHNNVKIIAAGDPYQSIYYHLNDGQENRNFENFGKWFGKHEVIELSKSYRSHPAIQRFVNGFYKKHYEDGRIFDLAEYGPADYTYDVSIHSLQHQQEVIQVVKDIIARNPDKTIKVLGRVHKEIDPLKELESSRVTLSTIHSEKGNEADVVIIVNTIFNDRIETIEQKNIWNVALTRAREKLHIVTSFPEEGVLGRFEAGTYTLVSGQKKLSCKSTEDIPDCPVNLTASKVRASIIDSLEIQLDYANAPYIPREPANLEKKSLYRTDTILSSGGFDYVLHRHNGKLTFDFHDLNKLKNQVYSDEQILCFIIDVIKGYFDYRISDQEVLAMTVRRLDLAKHFRVPSGRFLDVMGIICRLAKYSDDKTCLYEGGSGRDTLYLNAKSKETETGKTHQRGIRVYFPKFKSVNQLVDGDNVLKVELYRVRESGKTNNGMLNMPLKELVDLAGEGGVEQLFREWLVYEFPFIMEKPVKNVKLQQYKRGIKGYDDLLAYINRGRLSHREKRICYYVLLSFLPVEERKVMHDIMK